MASNFPFVHPVFSLFQSADLGNLKEKSRTRRPKKPVKSIYDYRPAAHSKDDLDLMPYLVEQVVPIEVATVDCQTPAFEERPPSPAFVPVKTGIDNGTQLSDEVFDFDVEVAVLLSVIVGKTMEQALLEVESEEEIACLLMEGEELEDQKRKEREEMEKLERESIKKLKEKKERLSKERKESEERDSLRAKVAAVRMMKQILPVMKVDIYGKEVKAKRWIVNDIGTDFMPWLYAGVTGVLAGRKLGGECVDEGIMRMLEVANVAAEAGGVRREAIRVAEEKRVEGVRRARKGKVKINITASSLGLSEDKVVGPIEITGADTVGDLEVKITDWLKLEEVAFTMPEEGFLQLGYEGNVLGKETVVMDIPGGELNVVGKKE